MLSSKQEIVLSSKQGIMLSSEQETMLSKQPCCTGLAHLKVPAFRRLAPLFTCSGEWL